MKDSGHAVRQLGASGWRCSCGRNFTHWTAAAEHARENPHVTAIVRSDLAARVTE